MILGLFKSYSLSIYLVNMVCAYAKNPILKWMLDKTTVLWYNIKYKHYTQRRKPMPKKELNNKLTKRLSGEEAGRADTPHFFLYISTRNTIFSYPHSIVRKQTLYSDGDYHAGCNSWQYITFNTRCSSLSLRNFDF